ncbi:MAG: aldo/keto reductase [Pseudomonadales bacterium]|nr:aldo/keto reductase [Pseudomonadales bacterium]
MASDAHAAAALSRRRLGRSDLEIVPLVFGSMSRRRTDPRERIALVREVVAHGLTSIDTAPLYDFGAVETLLGEALAVFPREHVQILGKAGLRWAPDARGRVLFEFTGADGVRRAVRRDSRPESLRRDVEESLQRLRVDYLDLLQIHHRDPDTPIAESMGALLELRREGRIRAIGVSNFNPDEIRAAQAALGDVPLASVQPEFSLLRRGAAADVLPVCRERAVGVLAYSPLAWGLLAGIEPPGVPPATAARARRLVDLHVRPIATRHGVPSAAVALAWVLAWPGMTGAIAGASSAAQLAEQLPALTLSLTAGELEELTAAFATFDLPLGEAPPGPVRGLLRRVRRLAGRSLRAAGIDPARVRQRLAR